MKILTLFALQTCLFCGQVAIAQSPIVTAAEVNGTWRSQLRTLKLWALGQGRLQVEFSGTYEYRLADGSLMANTGQGSGIASIEGLVAKFKPAGAEDECLIKMKFIGGGLQVEQVGICGFGHNVSAAGTYRKISSSKPNFGAE